MGKKSLGFLVLFMCIAVGILAVIVESNRENSYISEYRSLEALQNKVTLEFEIPEFIVNSKDNLEIKSIYNQMVMLYSDNFEFRACEWQGNHADPMGIYEKYDIDNQYYGVIVSFARFRQDENKTIINWVKDDIAYEIMFNSIIDIEDAFTLVNVDTSSLVEMDNIETSTEDETTETTNKEETSIEDEELKVLEDYNVAYKIKVEYGLKEIHSANEAIYYTLDGKNALIVVYKNADKYLDKYGDNVNYYEYNNVYFMYSTENPFDVGTDSFDNYNNFMLTIDEILSSVTNIE